MVNEDGSRLDGRVALVTGGARRVGAAIVRALADAGCAVAIHYLGSHVAAQQLTQQLAAAGREAVAVRGDLTREPDIVGLFAEVARRLGPVEILVNNASVFERAELQSMSAESWDRVLDVNLRAPFLCIREALPAMRARGGGVVVNIADLAGMQAWPRRAHHCASKAGLLALTRSLAVELAPTVRVHAIAPGLVLHPDDLPDSARQRIERRIPRGPLGTPRDVAQAVQFLARAHWLTGLVLPLDGGRLAGRAVGPPAADSSPPAPQGRPQ